MAGNKADVQEFFKVDLLDNSLSYNHSYLSKEYEDEGYAVVFVSPELLKSACIAGGIRWPAPFNEWSDKEVLGIESKPKFFIRSFNPDNDDKDTITWMPSIFNAEFVVLKRTLMERLCNKNAKKQLKIIFKNGRHRAEFFRYFGAVRIPVLTKLELVETLSTIGA
jgi:hypothetical protein